jgi:hypothetical protein
MKVLYFTQKTFGSTTSRRFHIIFFCLGLRLHPLQCRVGDCIPGNDGSVPSEGSHLHRVRGLQLPDQHRVQRPLRLHCGKAIDINSLYVKWSILDIYGYGANETQS